MFATLAKKVARDPDYPARVQPLTVLASVLDGTLYDVLEREFHEEKLENDEYVPLRDRKPSVRYPLCRLVVEDSVSLLFGDGRFPTVLCPDKTQMETLKRIVEESCLVSVMEKAAIIGSVGSVAILMKVLSKRVFFDAMETTFLTPKWRAEEPDSLENVTERYKVTGKTLRAAGYKIDDDCDDKEFWFQRVWTAEHEEWYLPQPVAKPGEEDAAPKLDPERTVDHKLGFVPIVWIRNLPGRSWTGSPHDGVCTFRPAIETQIEIDYQLSQAGRGLKYSSDPTLLIKEPVSEESNIIKGADRAIVVSENGDAKMLEIGGTASAAVIEYCRHLRELALESIHGNRASADRLVVAQSGKAMELMHQSLIWLADRLRTPYGEHGLLELLRMVSRVRAERELRFRDDPMEKLPKPNEIRLRWRPWFNLTTQDKVQESQALATGIGVGAVSRETAVGVSCETYDIADPAGEMTRIDADQAASDAREMALAKATVQAKAQLSIPG